MWGKFPNLPPDKFGNSSHDRNTMWAGSRLAGPDKFGNLSHDGNTMNSMRILVLDVPALHLAYLGCYGNDWIATPNIDRLASESVVFDRHFFDVHQPSPSEWTGHHLLPGAEP